MNIHPHAFDSMPNFESVNMPAYRPDLDDDGMAPSQTFPNFTFYGDHLSDDPTDPSSPPPKSPPSHDIRSGTECPRCGSSHIQPTHAGRRWAGTAGTLAGAVHGGLNGYRLPRMIFGESLGGFIGSGAGTELGMVAGKRIGVLLGGPFGPVGQTAGRLAGATLGALVGGAAGCTLGSRLGRAVDQTVLKNYRCDDCGHVFRIAVD